jgi:hypothetical protein
MELVGQLRSATLRGAEKISSVWRGSVPGRVLLVLSAVLLAVVIFAILSTLLTPSAAPNIAGEQISGVFADVNGDGLVDYIVNAEVIVNNGPLGQ